jgi:20S proteasome alpha/beta subunit
MTCCVAALCDERKAIVLAADKMIGFGMIESEPSISKIFKIHKDWWVLIAGNDIAPAFDILDAAKRKLAKQKEVSIDAAATTVYEGYIEKREQQAEAQFLTPLGWTLQTFNSKQSSGVIPDATRVAVANRIQNHYLQVSLLVAGFDGTGNGHIFVVDDYDNRGVPRRWDIPGYHAIGSGSQGATYMMAWRELSPTLSVREALYYVAEGKYFGEHASGVGTRTDLFVLRFRKPRIRILEKTVDEKLMKLCEQLEPRQIGKKGVKVLNAIHGKLMDKVPKLKVEKENGEWVIKTL